MEVLTIVIEVLRWVIENTTYGAYVVAALAALGGVVTIASAIVPFTKTTKDDEILAKVKAAFQRLSVLKPKE